MGYSLVAKFRTKLSWKVAFFLMPLEEIELSYTQLIGQDHHKIPSYLKRQNKMAKIDHISHWQRK